MIFKCFCALTFLVFVCQAKIIDTSYYTAAVVEYESVWDHNKHPEDNLLANIKNYEKFIEAGHKKHADIIVFPEMGLVADNSSIYIPVPHPEDIVNPRLDIKQHPALRRLSEAAYTNKIYVVVNLLEISGIRTDPVKYNSDVVFDRNGTIIARYRKYNLFEEPYVNSTDVPDYSCFDTDFGVRFGIFTCFDILFPEPVQGLINKYNITDVVYPVSWFSELPLLTAVQVQAGWSYSTGINLLAAGQNNVTNYHSGTGIYAGKNGPLISRMADKAGSFMLYHKVPKNGAKMRTSSDNSPLYLEDAEEQVRSAKKLMFFREDFGDYESRLLPDSLGQVRWNSSVCQGGLCCRFSLDYTVKKPGREPEGVRGDLFHRFRYRAAVVDGTRYFGTKDLSGVQVCALVPCLDHRLSSCGLRTDSSAESQRSPLLDTRFDEVRIAGTFQARHSFVFPDILLTSNKTDFQFGRVPSSEEFVFESETTNGGTRASLILKSEEGPLPIGTAGIYARLFDRDRKLS